MMADAVFLLCAVTSLACAALLLRGYSHNKVPLLLWSSLCFVGLAINNVLLVVDFIILPEHNLSTVRHLPALVGMLLLVYGLIWDSE
jgi:hypothetical protein